MFLYKIEDAGWNVEDARLTLYGVNLKGLQDDDAVSSQDQDQDYDIITNSCVLLNTNTARFVCYVVPVFLLITFLVLLAFVLSFCCH